MLGRRFRSPVLIPPCNEIYLRMVGFLSVFGWAAYSFWLRTIYKKRKMR